MRMLLCVLGLGLCAAGAGCAAQPDPPPFKPVANVDQLMDGVITPAAEIYWGSVSTTVDKDGVTEKFPMNDEEWEAVWGGAMTIAESGNLLMMAPRSRDDGEWLRLSAALVDAGVAAAKAAESKNPEQVLAEGEKVYNVCTECHMKYIMDDEG